MRIRLGRIHAALPLLLAFAWPVVAQTAPAASPPRPEHLQLGFFVGRWKYAGDVRPGPLGPGGKSSGTETCDWFSGKFFVVCRSEWVTGGAVSREMGIVGYSEARKHYSFYDIDDAQGEAAQGWGDFADSTWTWEEAQPVDGQAAKQRYTLREIAGDSFAFREEVAVGTQPWLLVETGTATRER